MKSFLIFAFLLPAVTLANPYGFRKGSLHLFSEASTLTTNKNFDDNGNLYLLNSPNQLKEFNLDLGGSYDLNSAWGIHADTNIRQVTAQSFNYNNTTTGLSDVTLGSDFLLFDADAFRIIPDLSLLIPLTSAPGSSATAFINDGAFKIKGLVYLSSHFWILDGALYGGYLYRTLDLSSQIPLGAISHATISKKFFIDLSAFGEISLADDKYTNTPANRNLIINADNGGSFLYDSVNPSFFAIKGSFGWNISKALNISAGVRQTVVGYKVADETRLFANLTFQANSKKTVEFTPSRREQRDGDDNFQVDTEGE